MTLLDEVKAGRTPSSLKEVAAAEGVDRDELRARVARGRVVIPRHAIGTIRPQGVGEGLRTKVNANLGTSPGRACLQEELRKLEAALEAGADSLMDLSVGGDLAGTRRAIRQRCPVMLGSVPVYSVAARLAEEGRPFSEMTEESLFQAIETDCRGGVDFITVHCGVTLRSLEALRSQPRTLGIVSRGGALLAAWMSANASENPLYASFDRLLEIASAHDVTLSLGDALRPGSLGDANDRGQLAELVLLGELASRARAAGVQVMIEGPGHVPLEEIAAHVRLEKRLCDGAPFYLLGPLTTDAAAGHDHIAGAIGGAIAAAAGADFLCYVTPAEHLKLPDPDEVREGVVAARIAGHSGDLAKRLPSALARDLGVSTARAALDWDGMLAQCLDPAVARAKRAESGAAGDDCTMCGELCAVRTYNQRVARATHQIEEKRDGSASRI